jgi:signal transduction histidine kinase
MENRTVTTPRPRILIIDDTPANLQLLVAELAVDFDLQIATTGALGLEYARQVPPDLVLLDVMMPEMDGFEVCRRLNEDVQLSPIPVIFLTVLGDGESERVGLALGAADYITKPINVGIARLRIGNLLEREQLRKELESHRDHLEELVLSRSMALSIAKDAAGVAQRAKNNFLNNITHELRTPMNAIMGYTGLALARATDPAQADLMEKAQLASEQLLGLISQLMDLTEIQTRQIDLQHTPFRLSTVLNSVPRLLGQGAMKKKLELSVDVQPGLADLPLHGDPLRLGQILLAITDNAIKFTAKGSVRVQVSLEEQTTAQVVLRFEVHDTGVGIAAADQKRIFGLFEQLDDSSLRRHGGTGLGLALSKQLIDLMGGFNGIKSQIGVGSVFWFTLPLDKLESVS